MRKNDFLQIYEEIMKKAEELTSASGSAEVLAKYKIYKSYLKQITQILKEIDDKSEIQTQIEDIRNLNENVLKSLRNEKEGLFKNIRTNICREHLRKKYDAENQKSSLINKKA
jgi:hypothetical protein